MTEQPELTGQPVLIHPRLTHDPFDKKNKIGVIISADFENNEITVDFGNEGRALFSTDSVLVLRDPEKIRSSADDDYTLMPIWDYGEIMNIASLVESGRADHRKYAVQLAQKDPEIFDYILNSLRHELNLETQKTNIYGRNP
jgi:hypothetical protein